MKHWHMRRISLEAAESEPQSQHLFGPSYDARQKELHERTREGAQRDLDVWQKPRMIRRSESKL